MPQVGPRSLYFDVTGEARKDRVKLPSCIRGGKPGALPNTQVCDTAHCILCCNKQFFVLIKRKMVNMALGRVPITWPIGARRTNLVQAFCYR